MTKPCTTCGQQIPQAAAICSACGVSSAPGPAPGAGPGPATGAGPATAVGELLAEPASEAEERPGPPPPPPPRAPVYSLGTAVTEGARAPFGGRLRLLHGLAGVALTAVFLLPWNETQSWHMLPYLRGLDFLRQLWFLAAGTLLLSTAALPVPAVFRAAAGAVLGVFGLSLGGVMLSPFQGALAMLVVVTLPGALLCRTRMKQARLPRLLGLMSVLALFALYLAPREHAPPLRVAVDLLLYKQDDMARFIGTYLLLPLPLVSLAAVALIGADVAPIGELLSWLLFCWGPGAVLVLAIDRTQAYMAVATLCYSVIGGYGMADLLCRLLARLDSRQGAS